jgi:hypothetical protein
MKIRLADGCSNVACALAQNGEVNAAPRSVGVVCGGYPRDRVAVNQIAHIEFVERRYADALRTLKSVNAIDPEDGQMHYTLMLCYRGLDNAAADWREEHLFRRFKAGEAMQALIEGRRQASPEDNNERRPVHEHKRAAPPEAT